MKILTLKDIDSAYHRIKSSISVTPIYNSPVVDQLLGGRCFFKNETVHSIGAFKIRGALNFIEKLKEKNKMPRSLVSYSSGNHAQALAYVGEKYNIRTRVYMPATSSSLKIEATRNRGAEVVLCPTREDAEIKAHQCTREGWLLVPPYDHDDIICGQGTSCFEALKMQELEIDAVFVPCGGGGLLSGTTITAKAIDKDILVFGVEPESANDASLSYKAGSIHKLSKPPDTIADGVKTLSLSERTFYYIKKSDGIIEVSEHDIIKWTQFIFYHLGLSVEPTAALGLAGASYWLKKNLNMPRILIILTGNNSDSATIAKIWPTDHL